MLFGTTTTPSITTTWRLENVTLPTHALPARSVNVPVMGTRVQMVGSGMAVILVNHSHAVEPYWGDSGLSNVGFVCLPTSSDGFTPSRVLVFAGYDNNRFPVVAIRWRFGKTMENFPALADENRPTVNTAAASHYLGRKPQTLRGWSCLKDGPLTPIRIHGRLAWRVADIRRLLGVEV